MEFGVYRNLVFVAASVSYIIVFIHRLSMSVLVTPISEDLEIAESALAPLSSYYFWTYALVQPLVGRLSDSLGPKRLCMIAHAIACISALLIGLAPGLPLLSLGRILVGLGVAPIFVPTQKIFAQFFTNEGFVRACGLLLGIGGVGGMLAATPMKKLADVISWRTIHLILAGISASLFLVYWVFVENKPQDRGYPAIHPAEKAAKSSFKEGLKICVTRRHFWVVSLFSFFASGCYFTLASMWGGQFIQDVFNKTSDESSNVLLMLSLSMIIGSPLLAEISKTRLRTKGTFMLCGLLNLLPYVVIFLVMKDVPIWLMYIFYFLIGVNGNASTGVAYASIKSSFPMRMTGTAMGLYNIFPFIGAAIISQLSTTFLKAGGKELQNSAGEYFWEVSAYESLFKFLSIFGCVSVVMSIFVSNKTWEEFVARRAEKKAHTEGHLDEKETTTEGEDSEHEVSIGTEELVEEVIASSDEHESKTEGSDSFLSVEDAAGRNSLDSNPDIESTPVSDRSEESLVAQTVA